MPNAERRMQNAERRMHCLLAVTFTCVCLRLAFICWTGPNTIKCCPFQQIKANCKQAQVKLTASKQCIRRSAFCIRRSAFYPCRLIEGRIINTFFSFVTDKARKSSKNPFMLLLRSNSLKIYRKLSLALEGKQDKFIFNIENLPTSLNKRAKLVSGCW